MFTDLKGVSTDVCEIVLEHALYVQDWVRTKLCAGCVSYWSRLAFRPPGVLFLTPTKHAAETRHCPCRLRAPQREGGYGYDRVRVGSGVGLVSGDVQG